MTLTEYKQSLPDGVKLRPILFSTPMVQAILEGRKTQTRRVIKKIRIEQTKEAMLQQCPYGKPGDILWVRETWAQLSDDPLPTQFLYKATDNPTPGTRWKPSIHIPFEAARIFLRIKSVRTERLNVISREDAAAEGVCISDPSKRFEGYQEHRFPEENFKTLWDSVSGRGGSWNTNPLVWVVEFERI